jgi:hypothetical protein
VDFLQLDVEFTRINLSILKILHCYKVSRSQISIDLGHFRGIAIAG